MRRLASVVVGRAAPRLRPFNHGSQASFITGSAPSRPSADLCFASGPLFQPVRSCNGITLPAGASFHSPQVAGQQAIPRCFSSIPSFSSAHDANSSATGSYILRAELADAFAEGGPDAAAPVFDSIPPEDRTISEWMAMISRSARDHRPALALRYLNLFLVNYSGLPPIVVDVDASFGMTRNGIPMSELDMIDAYRFSPSIHSPFFSPDRHHAVARARADRRDALPSAEGDSPDLQALIRYASLSAAPIPRVLPSANAMRAVVESIIHVASLARDGAAIVGAFADPGAGAGALYLAFPCARPEDQCEAASSAVPDNAISVSSSSSDTVYHPSWPVTLPARAHHTQLATCSLLVMRTAAQLGLPLAADNIAPLLRRLSRLLPSDALPDIVDTMDIVAVSPAVAPAYPDCPPTPPGPLAEAEAAASTVRGAWACAAAASLREPSAKFLGSLASVAPPGALRLTHVLEMSRPAILSEAVALAVLRATAATTEAARIGTHVAGVNALSLVESVRTMAQREGTGSMELEIQYARALQLAGRATEAWGHLATALAAPEAAEGDPAVIGGAYSVLLQSLSLMPSLTPVQRVAVAATVFRMLQTRAGVDGAVPAPAPAVDHLVFLVTRTRDWALITDILAAIICQTPLRATIASALLPHALQSSRGRDCFDWSVAVGSEGDALAAIVEVFPDADWEAALLSRAPTLVRYQEALLTVTDDSVTGLLRDLAAAGGAMTAAAADPASDVVFLCPLSSVSGSGSGSSDPAPGEEEFSTAVAAASANPLSRGGFKFSAYFGPHTISNVLDTFSSVSRPVAKRAHTAPSSSSSSRDRGKDRDSRGQAGNAKDDEGANAVMAAELTHFPPSLTRAHAVASLYSLAQAMDVLLSPRMTRALIQALIATTPDPAAALSVITDLLESAAEAGVVMDRSFAPLLLSFAFGIDPAAGLQVARTLAAMGIPISSDAIKTVLQAAARAGASRAVHEFFPKIYGAVPEPAKGQQQLCDGNTPSKDASYESFSSALASLRTGPLSVPAASAEAVDSDRNLYESVFLATQVGPWATASRLDALMALNCVDSLVNMQLEHLQHQQQHQQGGYGRGRNGGRSGRSSSSSSNNGSNDPLAPLIAALTLRVPFDLANAAEQVASVSPPVQGWAIMRRLASAKDALVPTVPLPYAPALSLSRLIGTAMTVYRALGALATPGELEPEAVEAVRRAFTVADDAVTAAAAAVDAGAGASPMPRKAFASSMGGLFSSTGASSALSASIASSSAPVAASVQAASSPFALPLSVLQGNYRRLRKIRALVSSEARLGQQLGRSRKMMLSPQAWAGVSGEVEELVRPLGGIDRIDWALLPKNVWEGACGAIPSSRPPDAIPKFVPFRDEGAA